MDKLSQNNEERLDNAIKLIDKITAVGNSGLQKFPTKDYDLLIFFFINYLERFTFSLDNINILLRQYKHKPSVDTSIGLILRACLLDFMTITYLSTYFMEIKSNGEGKEKFDKQFNSLVSDHVLNAIKYLKLCKDSGFISEVEYKEAIKNNWETYSFLFSTETVDYVNPLSKLNSQDYISPKELFTRIHNHSLTKKFSQVYDLYTYYSKYDHFGLMTHFMQRKGPDHDFDTMTTSMMYVVRGIGGTFSYLSGPEDILAAEKKEIAELSEAMDKL
jgi:hypothetical protein